MAEIVESDQSAFVAIYGRRRVGKTYLVKEFFNHQFAFFTTGLANNDTQTQLANFTLYLNEWFGKDHKTPKNWLLAFHILQIELAKTTGTRVVFIDELPWLDTKKSDSVFRKKSHKKDFFTFSNNKKSLKFIKFKEFLYFCQNIK